MKKYLFLVLAGTLCIMLFQTLPILQNQFAAPCATVGVINDDASEVVSCKGVIQKEAKGGYVALLQISEDDISRIAVGQSVEIHCNALGNTVLAGELTTLSEKAYQTSYGSMKITVVDAVVTIEGGQDKLKSGYSTTADIVLTKEENATIIPFEAVAREKDGAYYIYRLENGWAQKEYIDVIFEDEQGVVVAGKPTLSVLCENPEQYKKDRVKVKENGND